MARPIPMPDDVEHAVNCSELHWQAIFPDCMSGVVFPGHQILRGGIDARVKRVAVDWAAIDTDGIPCLVLLPEILPSLCIGEGRSLWYTGCSAADVGVGSVGGVLCKIQSSARHELTCGCRCGFFLWSCCLRHLHCLLCLCLCWLWRHRRGPSWAGDDSRRIAPAWQRRTLLLVLGGGRSSYCLRRRRRYCCCCCFRSPDDDGAGGGGGVVGHSAPLKRVSRCVALCTGLEGWGVVEGSIGSGRGRLQCRGRWSSRATR
mmetsp:Transcript_26467/g.56058  ORF Transcript_26467/g.56058 Transcript_26467/m.56058 type:complete len:259 (-) Transcript_26467:672-1448(-)